MKLKITTIIALVSFAVIQVVVAPTASAEDKNDEDDEADKMAPLTDDELQTLLKASDNATAVREVLNLLAKNKPEEAKQRIKKLKKKKISRELLWLLRKLVKTPEQTYMLTLHPALVALHNKLKKESTTYSTFVGPVRNFIEGTGYLLLRLIGVSVQSTAGLVQILNKIIEEGTTAYYGETPHPERFKTVDENAQKIRNFGAMLDKDGGEGFEIVIERAREKKNPAPSAKADGKGKPSGKLS